MGFLRWLFLALFCGVAIAMLVGGWYQIREQHRKISTYVPAVARVQSASVRVQTSTDSDGHTTYTYYPEITYAYAVEGKARISNVVTPISRGGSSEWANGVVNEYSDLGKQYEAYYNPANPEEAFLVRRHFFDPYMIMLIGLPLFTVGSLLFFGINPNTMAPKPPEPKPSGWFELRPARSVSAKQNAAWLVTAAWFGYLALVSGHYFSVAEKPYAKSAYVLNGILAGLGAIPALMLFYYLRLGRMLGEARVFARAASHAAGGMVIAHVEQAVRAPLKVDAFKVGVVCLRHIKTKRGNKTSYSTETAHEQWTTLANGQEAKARELLQGEAEFTLPLAAQPTSPPTQKEHPKHAWMLVVETAVPGAPDYKGKFPILVTPS